MSLRLKIHSIIVILFCFAAILQTEKVFGFQSDKTDVKQLRKLFTETVGQDFEIIKDILDTRAEARGGETYWLVHVKPKQSGHYALKYTYKFTHKFEYPEEGENTLFIRVGEKNCNRYNSNNLGLGNVCLGDTVIVPIRVDRMAEHQFSLKSTYQDGKNIGKNDRYPVKHSFTEIEQVSNPLEQHLKYLGTQRSVMPHRSCCDETITYTAYFEAKEPGRFNFAVNSSLGDENSDKTIKINPLDALPIIILNPGTPITALTFSEDTINYGDKKRFSAHAGHQFLTRLLILQPGDIFAIEYSSYVNREYLGKEKLKDLPKINEDKTAQSEKRKLVMHKLPFTLNKDWSYNAWLADYLPKTN